MTNKNQLPPRLIGDRVSDDILDRIGTSFRTLWPESENIALPQPDEAALAPRRSETAEDEILVSLDPDDQTFARFNGSSIIGIHQVQAGDRFDDAAIKLTRLARNDLIFVSLTSRSAYGSRLVAHLSEKIDLLFGLKERLRLAVRTSLIEALQNAIVHGNLELPSPSVEEISDFGRFASRINERLQDKILGGRAIDIGVWKVENSLYVSITDHGKGFDLDAGDQMNAPDGECGRQYTGRGRMIMQEMTSRIWVDQGGRRTTMRFD